MGNFRGKDINTLSLQLSRVQQYADNLRRTAWFTVFDLDYRRTAVSRKRYDHALDLIQQQSESHQKVLDFIARNFGIITLPGY